MAIIASMSVQKTMRNLFKIQESFHCAIEQEILVKNVMFYLKFLLDYWNSQLEISCVYTRDRVEILKAR